jgi:drug/metabolite transporter (DMT)-like permease
VPLLGVFVLLQRGRLPSRRDWPGIVVCGVLWFGLYNLALNEAEQRVDAGTAAMLVNIGPILIALLAGFLLGEGFPARARRRLRGRVPRRRGHRGRHLGAGGAASWGAILCVAAAAFYAGGVVAQKPLLSRLSGLHVTWAACTIGLLVCLPFTPTLVDELGSADGSSVAWMVYLGAFPTAVGFLTWAYALSRTTAGRMGATTYLVPPIAILIGGALLAESPETLAFLGGALCLGGVVITRR